MRNIFTSAYRILLGMTSAIRFQNTSLASQKVWTRSNFLNPIRAMSENTSSSSIHAAHIHEIHEVPFEILIRSFPSELDEAKVVSLMETLKNPLSRENVPPVDVLWITGREGGNYYFSFGGCHRYEAHKRLGLPTIRCKLVKSTVNDLRHYLGGSTPDLK